jgi:uncharacterized protein (TIGR02246 family)
MARLNSKDQGAIRQLWTKYAASFDKQKPRAIARLYAPDGDLIGIEGELVTGPAAIEEYYVDRFSKLPSTARISDSKIAPARIVAGSVALVNGTWSVLGVGPDPIEVVATFVVRRDQGTWRYVAARFIKPFTVP